MTTTEHARVTPTARLVLGADAPHDEWLAARKGGIGSSDAAAILGLDPWNSPLSLWLEKTNTVESDEQNEAMRWGQVLEGPIADEFAAREGFAVLPAPGVLAHHEIPWLMANPDRMLAPKDSPLAAFSFVEVKNVSAWKAGEWDAEAGIMPPNYLIQVMHQLAVTGYDVASVACLIGGQHLEYLTVHRDQDLIDQLIEREAAFWDLVLNMQEPAWDGSTQSIDAVSRYRAEPGKVFELTPEHDGLIRDIIAAKEETARIRALLRAAEASEKRAVGAVKALMGTAEIAVYNDAELFTWKEAPRAEYTVEAGTVRTFRLVKQSIDT